MKKSIKNLPEFDRPREKMAKKGPKALSALELLAIVLSSGTKEHNVWKIAQQINKLLKENIETLTLAQLRNIEGVGLAKACQIMAAIELARRFLIKEGIQISNFSEALKLVTDLEHKKQEHFITITLDGAGNLINKRTVFIGTLNQTLVHPREVFADALTDRAAGIILVHNHPSGNPNPSNEDIKLTEQLVKAGELLGIEVIDHIIIGKKDHYSFSHNNLLSY